jgi:hypothetical protein
MSYGKIKDCYRPLSDETLLRMYRPEIKNKSPESSECISELFFRHDKYLSGLAVLLTHNSNFSEKDIRQGIALVFLDSIMKYNSKKNVNFAKYVSDHITPKKVLSKINCTENQTKKTIPLDNSAINKINGQLTDTYLVNQHI